MNEAAKRRCAVLGLAGVVLFACSPEDSATPDSRRSASPDAGPAPGLAVEAPVLRLVPTLSDPAVEMHWTPPPPIESGMRPILHEDFEAELGPSWRSFDHDRAPMQEEGPVVEEGRLRLAVPTFVATTVPVEPGAFYEVQARVRVTGEAGPAAPSRAVSGLAQPLKSRIDWSAGPGRTLRQIGRAHATRSSVASPLLPDPERAGEWHEIGARLRAPFDASGMLLTFLTLAGGGQELEIDSLRFAQVPLREALGLERGASEPQGMGPGAGGLFEGWDAIPAALARQVEVHQERRAALILPPPASVSFLIDVPDGDVRLEFARAILEPHRTGDLRRRVELSVEVESDAGLARLHRESIGVGDPGTWEDRVVDLSPYAGEVVRLHLRTTARASTDTLLVGSPLIRQIAEEDPRPNVVVVSLDTLRADRLGIAGHARGLTPRIDALARESVYFRDVTSTSSYTLPAHASLLTGQLPRVHGVRSPGFGPTRISERRSDPLARRLADAGWLTAAFTGGVYVSTEFGFATGFDRFDSIDSLLSEEDDRWFLHPRPRQHADNLQHRRRRGLDHVLDWTDAHRDGAFFLLLHTYLVHNYQPSPPYREELYVDRGSTLGGSLAWPRRRSPPGETISEVDRLHYEDLYDATLREADELVGRLVDHLRENGTWENTIFVLVSDHGEEFGEHGEMGHGHSLYQELVSVPLLIRIPGLAPRQVTTPVSLVDVVPTLYEVLGLESRRPVQGRSLWSCMQGEELTPRELLFEVMRAGQAPLAGVRSGPWKLLARYGEDDPAAAPSASWLYHLAEDRDELQDAASREPARAREMARRLARSREDLAGLGQALGTGEAEAGIPESMRAQLERLGYLPPRDPTRTGAESDAASGDGGGQSEDGSRESDGDETRTRG